jgi:hypothetical protein
MEGSSCRDIATCDAPNFCELETPNAETPMGATMFATCPDKRTVEVWSRFRVSRFCKLRCQVSLTTWNPECRFDDALMCCHLSSEMDNSQVFSGYRDIAYRSFGVQAFARPTLDYRCCDERRSTAHDLSLSTIQNDS